MRATLAIAAAIAVAGCTGTIPARLYTQDGRIIPASFTWDGLSGKGQVSGEFPDGEVFQGEYFTQTNSASAVGLTMTPWGPITTLATVQTGPQVSHTTAVGNQGTTIMCVSYPRGSSGFGGCRDSKGREFRLHY